MNQNIVRLAVVILILIGSFLRLLEYLPASSLNNDEALTASKISSNNLISLISPVNNDISNIHAYPAGFLAGVKVLHSMFGNHEYVYRLIPFACGILSLILFALLSFKCLANWTAIVSLSLFVFSRDVIYHANELKPYSSDIFIILMLIILSGKFLNRPAFKRWFYGLFLVVLLSTLGSFSSFFFIPGILCLLFCCAQKQKDRILFFNAAILTAGFILIFGAYYVMSLRFFSHDQSLNMFWNVNFMPIQDGPIALVKWVVVSFKRFFSKFMNLPASLSAFFFLVGCIHLLIQRSKKACVLIIPFALVLSGSALKKYPFDGRVVHFLIPLAIILICLGVEVIVKGMNKTFKRITTVLISLMILFYPVILSSRQALEITSAEDIKPVLEYVRQNFEDSHVMGIYDGTVYSYRFYDEVYGLPTDYMTINKPRLAALSEEFNKLSSGDRIWIVFSHVRFFGTQSDRVNILKQVHQRARLKRAFELPVMSHSSPIDVENSISASAYLFEII